MSLRIVLDTSVLIAALGWRGAASRLLGAGLDGTHQLVLSNELLDELREKLQDPKFTGRLRPAGTTPALAVVALSSAADLVTPVPVSAPNLRDPSDLHVLAAAVAGADIIVSRDKDLLSLGAFEGIPIMSVEDCLHTLGMHQ